MKTIKTSSPKRFAKTSRRLAAKSRPRLGTKALRALERLADEDRAPARWIQGADDPTKK